MPMVKRMLKGYRDYLSAARQALMSGRDVRGRAREQVSAAIGHALTFGTWRSLAREQGLTDAQVAGLMCRMVAAVLGRSMARGATQGNQKCE